MSTTQEIMDRLVRGETVTPKQLSDARAAADLAEMQESAAAVREQEAAVAAYQAKLEALQARASTDFDGSALVAPRVRLEEAIDDYLRAAVEHNVGVYRLGDAALATARVLKGLGGMPKGFVVTVEGPEVRIGDVSVRHVAPRGKLEAMLREAVARFFPRGTQ